ncbi:hypothetical protein EV421DRAFT_1716061, partial [Armillaria borealis]
GKACFLCTSPSHPHLPHDVDILAAGAICPFCVPSVPLDPSKPHRFLEHIGAHILNKSVLPSTEPCGLCGLPSSSCQFYLTKGKGSGGQMKTDYRASRGCPNLGVRFKYGIAKISRKTAPCSNVPFRCPICPENAPAIWKYMAKYHFMNHHPATKLDRYAALWTITNGELKAMNKVWKNRKKVMRTRGPNKRKKSVLGVLVISDVHTTAIV